MPSDVQLSPCHPDLKIRDVVRSRVCPKAKVKNVTEYQPLWRAMERANALGWSSRRKSAFFLVLRGVRGKEGVRKSAKKILRREFDMGNKAHINAFGNSMLKLYERRVNVKKDKPVSFLSHAEGHHSGLSGGRRGSLARMAVG